MLRATFTSKDEQNAYIDYLSDLQGAMDTVKQSLANLVGISLEN